MNREAEILERLERSAQGIARHPLVPKEVNQAIQESIGLMRGLLARITNLEELDRGKPPQDPGHNGVPVLHSTDPDKATK